MLESSPLTDSFISVIAPLEGVADTRGFVIGASQVLMRNFENYELIIVDNGLSEEAIRTLLPLLAEYPGIRLIRLSRSYDRETAIFAGLDAAIGDHIGILLPESDSPEYIVELVNRTRAGYDIVYGVSTTPRHHSVWSRLTSRLFHWYTRRYLRLDIPTNTTYLIGFNRKAVNALTRIKGRYRHIRHLSRQVGFKTTTFQYRPHSSGSRKERGVLDAFNLAMEIAVSYSRHPLRLVSLLGLFAGAINMVYALYVIAVYLIKDQVAEGWTTLSLQVAGMFFLVFLILVMLSEYVGRILEETRQGPDYHLMEELDSKVLIPAAERRNVTTETTHDVSR